MSISGQAGAVGIINMADQLRIKKAEALFNLVITPTPSTTSDDGVS